MLIRKRKQGRKSSSPMSGSKQYSSQRKSAEVALYRMFENVDSSELVSYFEPPYWQFEQQTDMGFSFPDLKHEDMQLASDSGNAAFTKLCKIARLAGTPHEAANGHPSITSETTKNFTECWEGQSNETKVQMINEAFIILHKPDPSRLSAARHFLATLGQTQLSGVQRAKLIGDLDRILLVTDYHQVKRCILDLKWLYSWFNMDSHYAHQGKPVAVDSEALQLSFEHFTAMNKNFLTTESSYEERDK
eukprot:g2248.t1